MNLSVARLALLGSRASLGRLFMIGAGVALGVAAFLLLWGAGGGLQEREQRTAWLYTHGADVTGRPAAGQALWARSTDYHRGTAIVRRELAAGSSGIGLPGMGTAPRPGEYYASPALERLIAAAPRAELGDRYGTLAGTLPASLLAGPDSLVVVKGVAPGRISGLTTAVTGFDDRAASRGGSYRTVMLMGGIAVFFPVLLLVGIATRLGAAARAERFATLRLIGARPGTLARLAAWEMGAVSLAGGLAGAALAWALRPAAALLSLGDGRLYTGDLAVSPGAVALVVSVMAAVSAATAAWRIRRADIGPLGAARQRRERTPTALRVLPLVAGLALMEVAVLRIGGFGPEVVQALLLSGFALITVGIAVVGPWLTLLAGRLLERRAGRAPGVIAGSRIRATPAATFRSVSGMVVAVFTVSVFAGAASSVDRVTTPDSGPGLAPVGSVFARVDPDRLTPAALRAAAQGADRLIVAYAPPDAREEVVVSAADARALGFRDLPAARHIRFDPLPFLSARPDAPAVPAAGRLPKGHKAAFLIALTDGTSAAKERARTALDTAGAVSSPALSRADLADLDLRSAVGELARLAYVGVFVAILIAGVSLAVSTAAAMLDRRRVLGLMRLMGMPARTLRRVIAYETAIPLAAVLVLSLTVGFGVAWLILEGLADERLTMSWPDPRFFLTLAAALVLTLTATAAATSLVRRHTGLTTTRFE